MSIEEETRILIFKLLKYFTLISFNVILKIILIPKMLNIQINYEMIYNIGVFQINNW